MQLTDNCGAEIIARFLKERGIKRIFSLCGGHIMPIWMSVDREKIEIIDVRDERAAVHMAQAHAEVTGEIGVALVTAGPGLTNAITGIANADVSRASVLILSGTPPIPQMGRGALQDLDHVQLVRPITRYARTVFDPAMIPKFLDDAISSALGDGSEPGPAYLDFPTDVLRARVPSAMQMQEYFKPRSRRVFQPSRCDVASAVDMLWEAKRPVFISGRGARAAAKELLALLERLDAVHLDTGESRGVVPDDHPSTVASMRGAVMSSADVIVTVGRRLDFQLAFGSPAIFKDARFLRISDCALEIRDNRRGDVELFGTISESLGALVRHAGDRKSSVDQEWIGFIKSKHREKADAFVQRIASAPNGADGAIHPNRLLSELQNHIDQRSIVAIDGGDFLSFARVAISASMVLDPGPFGCIGVGVPYGVAASLARPDATVFVVTGDGSFGFNAIEVDTAVRHGAKVVIVVANNSAWQIEVDDQRKTYGKIVGTKLQNVDYAAMARAFGMYAQRVTRVEELAASFARALANRPALIDVVITTDAESSDSKSGLAWVPNLQPLAAWDDAEFEWRYPTRS
ncbi:MAG: thiamine pyrophosphate-binding protein [Afipia sp.]|nr:thiamine pyrophosphate-binding protein [Afipia sp.]OJW65681.1 MAG: acetolactate synthase [Afipia sp. 64-13]